ncbi:metal ABC transporter permease [Kiloniella sp. b19]|uniref:metal ABC transporter permease n=1 Tax=Kiloniella sp. GXU_MW_B19 TaxID=3141326 RepID=UPI0031DDC14A
MTDLQFKLFQDLLGILGLQGGYNTSLVLIGSALLGAVSGLVGSFSLLRKRALIADAVSHATLPGLVLGFLVAIALGFDGKSLPFLLIGSAVSGLLGVLMVQWIRDNTRLPEDSAIGTVLSSFFGLGVVLLSYVQTLKNGSQAGLEDFLLGSTASMLRSEAELIAVIALLLSILALAFRKEMALVCFDAGFAQALGWSVKRIDLIMMGLLLTVMVIGLKSVGLILVIALVIIPPVAARFWSDRLSTMLILSSLFGALSCYLGAALSALAPDIPSGATIVLTASSFFVLSLVFAPQNGVLAAALRFTAFRIRLCSDQVLSELNKGEPVPDSLTKAIGLYQLRSRGLVAPLSMEITREGHHYLASLQEEN